MDVTQHWHDDVFVMESSSAGRRFLQVASHIKLFGHQRPSWIVCLAGVIVLASKVATSAPALAESSAQEKPPQVIAFHILAQPLASALEAYSIVSKRQVIYNGNLAVGRQAAGVQGTFTPEVALRLLLEGSGLMPRYMAADAFVLVPAPADKPEQPVNTTPSALVAQYYGLIQTRLRQAFCADHRTQPGSYRLAVSFWIGPDGRVSRAELLSTTGARDRDAMIERTLRLVTIGVPPPIGFAQPVTLVVAPQSPQVESDCRTVRADQSSAGSAP